MARPLPTVTRWSSLAQRFGPRYGVPASTLLSLIQSESGGRPGLTSGAGAQGLTQFMPGTARQYHVNISDPASSIRGAAQYLHDLGYSQNPTKALASYNAGPRNWQAGLGYARTVLGDASSYKGLGSGPAPGYTPASSVPGPTSASGGSALAQVLARPQSSVSPPPAPAFAAKVTTPQTYQAPPGVVSPNRGQGDLRQTLAQILKADAPPQYQPSAAPAVGDVGSQAGSYGAAPSKGFQGGYPLGKRGAVIGTPFAGTHAKAFNVAGGSDNWQSENAVDIRVPIGTPVYAEANGTLGNTGSLGQGGRFAGLRTNLISKDNAYYYAHMSKLAPGIRAGTQVKKGQLLGWTGEANGVPHLHFAIQRGDPRKLVQ